MVFSPSCKLVQGLIVEKDETIWAKGEIDKKGIRINKSVTDDCDY